MYKGFKLNIPSQTYNMTVDHSRRILGSTLGHLATWNYKTAILYDELVCGVRDGVFVTIFNLCYTNVMKKIMKWKWDTKVFGVLLIMFIYNDYVLYHQ